MEVNYRSRNGRLGVKIEGESHSDIFQQIAAFQEVFEEERCGKCGSDNLRFVIRKVQDGKKVHIYHELRCMNYVNSDGRKMACRSKLAYGIHQDGGTLFPKRFAEDENSDKKVPIGANGWVRWNPETQKEE